MLILVPAFWFLVAFVLAALECEIGPPPARPLRLYHVLRAALITLLCHAGYALGVTFSWMHECQCLSLLFLFCPTWGLLWFALHPAYGLANLNRESAPWHRRWFFGVMPLAYAGSFALSLAFAVLGWSSQDAMILDVLDGIMRYLLWLFLIGLATDACIPPYRRWRARKKGPPPQGWVDSP